MSTLHQDKSMLIFNIFGSTEETILPLFIKIFLSSLLLEESKLAVRVRETEMKDLNIGLGLRLMEDCYIDTFCESIFRAFHLSFFDRKFSAVGCLALLSEHSLTALQIFWLAESFWTDQLTDSLWVSMSIWVYIIL